MKNDWKRIFAGEKRTTHQRGTMSGSHGFSLATTLCRNSKVCLGTIGPVATVRRDLGSVW